MFESLKSLFGGAKTDYRQLVKDGAIILDVRSKAEYVGGHIKGSVNIPVDKLQNNLDRLKDKSTPIITCCASGMRSESAKSMLKLNGYTQVYNGGGWVTLQSNIR